MEYLHVAIPPSKVLEYRRRCAKLLLQAGVPVREWAIWGRPDLFSLLIAEPSGSGDASWEVMARVVDEVLSLAQEMGGTLEYCHGVGLKLGHLMERELGPGLASDRITDRDGRPLAFYVDWDRDGVAEASVHYFSPDGQGWRELLLAGIDDLVRTFAIDGYFLDQTNSFFNDPAHDHYRGVSRVIDAIRHRHPDLLLAGEGLNDYLTALTPFGTVSRKNKAVGAPETRLADRLYQRYVRRFGQLLFSAEGRWGVFPRWLSPAPVDAENPKQVESDAATTAARQYQSSWLDAGILPTLALVNHTVDLDHPGVAEVLACAERYRATCL